MQQWSAIDLLVTFHLKWSNVDYSKLVVRLLQGFARSCLVVLTK